MAFVAPVLQQSTLTCDVEEGHCQGRTEQNIFFDALTMKPLIDNEGFRYALRLYHRFIQSSNCQDELRAPGSNPYARGTPAILSPGHHLTSVASIPIAMDVVFLST
jgi:hypothetical protein